MSYTPINSQTRVSLFNLVNSYGAPVWFVDQDNSPDQSPAEVIRLVFNHSTGEWLLPIEVGMSYGIRIANTTYSNIAVPAYIGGLADHVGSPERAEDRLPFHMWEISPYGVGKINGVFNPSTQMLRRFRVVPAGFGESIAEAAFGEYGTSLNSEIVVYQRDENVMRDTPRPKARQNFSKATFEEMLYRGDPATGLDEEVHQAAYQTGKSYLRRAERIALVHLVAREVVQPWLDLRYGYGNYSWTFKTYENIGWWENQNFEIPASPYAPQTGTVYPQIPAAQKRPHRPR